MLGGPAAAAKRSGRRTNSRYMHTVQQILHQEVRLHEMLAFRATHMWLVINLIWLLCAPINAYVQQDMGSQTQVFRTWVWCTQMLTCQLNTALKIKNLFRLTTLIDEHLGSKQYVGTYVQYVIQQYRRPTTSFVF